MKEYTEEQIANARKELQELGAKPKWFAFDQELITMLSYLATVEENPEKGITCVKDPILLATILYAWIEYFEKGVMPDKVIQPLLNTSHPVIKSILKNVLYHGCKLIDSAYVDYLSAKTNGRKGGLTKANNQRNDDTFMDIDWNENSDISALGDILPPQ